MYVENFDYAQETRFDSTVTKILSWRNELFSFTIGHIKCKTFYDWRRNNEG